MSDHAQGVAEQFTPDDAWGELVHKDDRTSPEDYPDMCLISFDELKDYMERNAAALRAPAGDDDQSSYIAELEAQLDAFGKVTPQQYQKEIAQLRAQVESAAPSVIEFEYCNWEGRKSIRQARPISIRFGTSEWHPKPQWLMLAFDIDKQAEREFAMQDMAFDDDVLAPPTLKLTSTERLSEPTACTCGGDPNQPTDHHDISCPAAIAQTACPSCGGIDRHTSGCQRGG